MQTLEILLEKVNELSTQELKLLNQKFLHPNDQRFCSCCHNIFTGIRKNFHIKRYYYNNDLVKPGWDSFCKKCASIRNNDKRAAIKKEPVKYIRDQMKGFKHRAKTLNIPFDLTVDHLVNLFYEQKSKCYYSGLEISFDLHTIKRSHPHRMMASLDRKIPSNGYVNGNVVWTAYFINRMKNDCSSEEFIDTCKLILDHSYGD